MEDKQVIGRARFLFGLSAGLVVLVALGCGGTTTNTEGVKTGDKEDTGHHTGNTPNFESEVGALDQEKVQSTLNRNAPKLSACFNDGLRRVAFMGGEIKFALRINQEGAASVAYMKESTLGDRATEACMLKALQGATWPSPVGGREGLAEGGFAFDPSPDERTPVALDPERLGKDLAKAKSAITTCRSSAGIGAGVLKVTAYIDTDGKPMSVGVSGADAKVEQAASCVVDALRAFTFPSPGSYAGKVSFSDD